MTAPKVAALLVLSLALTACPPPPTLDNPSPGDKDCGMLDPNVVLLNRLCPDQRTLMRQEGKPGKVQPGPAGGMSWVYEFHSGDVFGQRGGFRMFDFTREGKLVNKREQFLYQQEK
ncbi:MAG: hypothetical protein AB2A00_35070 [Myxococcota bacterium]